MSPRAASRLEGLGFERIYDYVAGKADWGSFGLPIEGRRDSRTRVGAYTRTDVPVCRPDDKLADVRELVRAAGWDTCFVTDARGVVLGRLGRAALARDEDVSVEEAMTPRPSTVRPSFELEKAIERMRTQGLSNPPVTLSDGTLSGVLRREDAEAGAAPEQRGREFAGRLAASNKVVIGREARVAMTTPIVQAGVLARTRRVCAICCRPANLRRTLSIAAAVGIVLTLINQLDVFVHGKESALTWVKVGLNFLVPFCVSNLGVSPERVPRTGRLRADRP